MDELIKQLREPCQYENCVLCQQAADAIEARDGHILTLQHEIMAEAESHAALVERLNKQIEKLSNERPVVVCVDCAHNGHCLTQEFLDNYGKTPLDRNTFFCADGERGEAILDRMLKPCPFCGDPAVFESFKERKGYAATVHCCGCPAEITTITYDTEKEAEVRAIGTWNRRADNV